MAWTAPRTWVSGEIVTASLGNTHWRDNLRYLKGLDGIPTIESGLIVDNTGGDEYLKLPLLSTAECATVLDAAGKVAYDEALNRIKFYGAILNSLVSTADVDDTPANGATTDPISSNWAYDFQQTLTTAGDLPYATAAGAWARLAIGTAGQVMTVNGAATAPSWVGIAFKASSGQYTGADTVNRAIAHGLGVVPKYVRLVVSTTGFVLFTILYGEAIIIYEGNAVYAVTAPTATNFYVGNAGSYAQSANANTVVYNWVAIG